MTLSTRKKISGIIFSSVPTLVTVFGAIVAIKTDDFDYLKKCVIAGVVFIPPFIWRVCAFFYNETIDELIEENENLKRL